MTNLSMHERLPFDEATTPSLVSTGELPHTEQITELATEAYERYRPERRRRGGGLHPRPGERLARAVRDLRRRCAGHVLRDRRRRDGVLDPERLQAVRLRPGLRGDRVRSRRGIRLGVNSTGFPFNSLMAVELNDDRTMNPLVNAGAIATTSLVPGDTAEEKWEHGPRRAVALRRPRAHPERGGLRVGVGHQPAQPGHRPPAGELRAALLRPRRRPPTSTPGSAPWT